jgi:uncharacterized protein
MLFLDSNIAMYVAGRDHPFKEPSLNLFRRTARGEVDAATDVEVLQEILYRYHHTREIKKGFTVFDVVLQSVPLIFPILLEDLLRAKDLLFTYREIQPRDAIHAAVMINRGLKTIVSYDRHFDGIAGIERVEP